MQEIFDNLVTPKRLDELQVYLDKAYQVKAATNVQILAGVALCVIEWFLIDEKAARTKKGK